MFAVLPLYWLRPHGCCAQILSTCGKRKRIFLVMLRSCKHSEARPSRQMTFVCQTITRRGKSMSGTAPASVDGTTLKAWKPRWRPRRCTAVWMAASKPVELAAAPNSVVCCPDGPAGGEAARQSERVISNIQQPAADAPELAAARLHRSDCDELRSSIRRVGRGLAEGELIPLCTLRSPQGRMIDGSLSRSCAADNACRRQRL